jgi:hypothetical protein
MTVHYFTLLIIIVHTYLSRMDRSTTPAGGGNGDGDGDGNKKDGRPVLPQLQPPATPAYVLRGHGSPIHALHFFARNARLASGDVDGWIVVWDTATKRPVTVWKAHDAAVLEVQGFGFAGADDGDDDGGDWVEIFTWVLYFYFLLPSFLLSIWTVIEI